jgi:dihydroorotase
MASVSEIRMPRPDDWHLHLRDGDNMASLLNGKDRS